MSRFGKRFGENGTFRLLTTEELLKKHKVNKDDVFSNSHDFLRFTQVARDFPSIQEIEVTDQEMFLKILESIRDNKDAIPLFIKNPQGHVALIDTLKEIDVEEGTIIAYLGKPIDFEDIVTAKLEMPFVDNQ
jgi:hypothetical protein